VLGALRVMFHVKREKVTENWRKLLHEELHNLYFSSRYYERQVIEDEMGEAYRTNG
jgi:hypothetical protein